jgi:23S rRNA (adenine2503-C2)-methyltransferase
VEKDYNGSVTSTLHEQSSTDLPASLGIKRYGLGGLRDLMAALGQPAYRAKQMLRWLYGSQALGSWGVASYDEMSNLPATLRTHLAAHEPLASPKLLRVQYSNDGSRKYLIRLADGARIETVALPGDTSATFRATDTPAAGSAAVATTEAATDTPADNPPKATPKGRLTVCFSTQVGCAMGCAFCATGSLGLTRQLAPGEMLDQLLIVARDFDRRPTNAVAMGEGEPLANYDATLAALRLMNAPEGPGIGARHLTLSTCGLLPGIRRLSTEAEQFTLAVSLHSAVQQTRDLLMPAVAHYPLTQLRSTLIHYGEKTGRRPTLEVALIREVNDTPAELDALVAFCAGMLVHINLIPLNPGGITGKNLQPASARRLHEVAQFLQRAGIETSVRNSRGSDIAGACGQLAAE